MGSDVRRDRGILACCEPTARAGSVARELGTSSVAYKRSFGRGAVAVASAVIAALVFTAVAAEAGKRKKKVKSYRAGPVQVETNRYAAFVVDAKSGRVLHAVNADAPRFPASLTKIMTAYLAFEEIEARRMSWDTRLEVSDRCAAMSPSKLGLRPGTSISLREGVMSIITKSANDAACTIAENISGSEGAFADRMTRTAKRIGMTRTNYENASGLPNSAQITTARDQATLGRAIQERFPEYYPLFSARSYTFRGRTMGNHNRLLGRVDGVDGIKTGYTRASGFNLVTSAKSGGRHVVAVVLGGRTGSARDARMASLVGEYLPQATRGRVTDSVFASAARDIEPETPIQARSYAAVDRDDDAPAATVPAAAPRTAGRPVAVPLPAERPTREATRPVVEPKPVRTASLGTVLPPAPPAADPIADRLATGAITRREQGATFARTAAAERARFTEPTPAPRQPSRATETTLASAPAPAPAARPAPAAEPNRSGPSGWVIQIGAFGSEREAETKLARVKESAGRAVAEATPFTQTVESGNKTFVRARFAGFDDKDAANAACAALKRKDFACLAVRQ